MNYCFASTGVTCAGEHVTAQDFIIEAVGLGNLVLEAYTISTIAPISTPGELNAGAFRGIERPTSDIVAFRLYNAGHVLDDLEFARVSVNPVPLPAALPLYATGLGLMGLFGWWRRRRAAAA